MSQRPRITTTWRGTHAVATARLGERTLSASTPPARPDEPPAETERAARRMLAERLKKAWGWSNA